jgi:hypothetical protein
VTDAIVFSRWLVVLLALAGILANLAISSDIKRNRRAARAMGQNGDLEDTARIDVRGTRAAVGAHAMFLVLGLLAAGSPIPDARIVLVFGVEVSRAFLGLGFALLWDAIQALVVLAQIRNQFDRVRYRSRLRT